MKKIYQAIHDERQRQILKWGIQRHNDFYWLGILIEEIGEIGKALIEDTITAHPVILGNGLTFDTCLNSSHINIQGRTGVLTLEKEIIQTAAVCIAWLESIESR